MITITVLQPLDSQHLEELEEIVAQAVKAYGIVAEINSQYTGNAISVNK